MLAPEQEFRVVARGAAGDEQQLLRSDAPEAGMTVPIERTVVNSSDVEAVQWTPDGFHVWYKGGRHYVYPAGVSPEDAEAAAQAGSPGRFIRALVQGLAYERLE